VGAAKATAAFASIKNIGLILAGVRGPGPLSAAVAGRGLGAGGAVAGRAVAGEVQMAEGAGLGYATNARALYGTNRALGGGVIRSAAGAAPAFARGAGAGGARWCRTDPRTPWWTCRDRYRCCNRCFDRCFDSLAESEEEGSGCDWNTQHASSA
jgi:hypothetical protein